MNIYESIKEFNNSVWWTPETARTLSIHCECGTTLYLIYDPIHHFELFDQNGTLLKGFEDGPYVEEILNFLPSPVVTTNFVEVN